MNSYYNRIDHPRTNGGNIYSMKKYMQAFHHKILEDNNSVITKAENLTKVNRVWKLIQNFPDDPFGIITAYSPLEDNQTNFKRQEKLEHELIRMRLGYIRFVSGYSYMEGDKVTRIEQPLLFVAEIRLGALLLLGTRHGQDTVIWGNMEGVSSYTVSDCEQEISLSQTDMLTAWTSLLFAPGTFKIPNNPNSLSDRKRAPEES